MVRPNKMKTQQCIGGGSMVRPNKMETPRCRGGSHGVGGVPRGVGMGMGPVVWGRGGIPRCREVGGSRWVGRWVGPAG